MRCDHHTAEAHFAAASQMPTCPGAICAVTALLAMSTGQAAEGCHACACQAYQPGMSRAELEDEQRRQRVRDGLDPEPSAAPSAARRGGGMGEDGSFSRPGAGFSFYRMQIST